MSSIINSCSSYSLHSIVYVNQIKTRKDRNPKCNESNTRRRKKKKRERKRERKQRKKTKNKNVKSTSLSILIKTRQYQLDQQMQTYFTCTMPPTTCYYLHDEIRTRIT